jgi:hypothetical protein
VSGPDVNNDGGSGYLQIVFLAVAQVDWSIGLYYPWCITEVCIQLSVSVIIGMFEQLCQNLVLE